MDIGYARVGRALPLTPDKWGVVGGDMEPPRLLRELALRHPNDRFIITSLCRDDPAKAGLPPNVINPWTPERLDWLRERSGNSARAATRAAEIERKTAVLDALSLPMYGALDGVIVWAGQHGTSNSRIRAVTDRQNEADGYTTPQDSFVQYAAPVLRGINHWRDAAPLQREEVWLIADARNFLKCRDLKWPLQHPILGQYDFKRKEQHERYGDTNPPESYGFSGVKWKTDHTWHVEHRYVYSQLEVCGITPEAVPAHFSDEWSQRGHFGIFINEARSYVKNNRRSILRAWVLPLQPNFVHGQWPKGHEKDIGFEITPAPWEQYFDLLRSVRCTFTTPSSGSGWATTKPWEAFAVGTVCFFHPAYDTQNHILTDAPGELREWLRVPSIDELHKRVMHLSQNEAAWRWIIGQQRALYDRAMQERRWIRMIEERIW